MADNEDGQERTEAATARRRQEARDQGRVARSAELSGSAMLLTGSALLATAAGGGLAGFAVRVLHESTAALSGGAMTAAGASQALRTIALGMMAALAPLLAGIVAVSVLVNVLQTRGLLAWSLAMPRLTNVNWVKGFRRIFSLDSVVGLLRALLKLIALAIVTWLVLRHHWAEMASLAETGPGAVLAVLRALGLRLALTTGLAFLVIAGADYAWQFVRHERSLRMSKEEIRLEYRETEGDPRVKARIRSMQRQRARQRMLQAVPRADVVVTNPTHVAVALAYDPEKAPAPIVVAMGERKLAERIKKIAREAGVPTVENRPVARALLATCTVGRPVPPALYAAVAEILAWVYRQRHPQPARAAGAEVAS